MSHDPAAQAALGGARKALDQRRIDTATRLSELAERRAAVEALGGVNGNTEAALAAKSSYDVALATFQGALSDERKGRTGVVEALKQWLDVDPASDARTMSAAYPVALFPVRIETRFDPPGAPTALKVRIYPDDILSETHEPNLTAAESDATERYWAAVGQRVDEVEAWRRLLNVVPVPRAAYLLGVTSGLDPRGVKVGSRPSSWTRPAEATLLPDVWVVLAYRDGQEVHRVVSKPVVEPLALTINPSSTSGTAADLAKDPDFGWAVDFDTAVAGGMAVNIKLEADDIRRGFDRLLVLGLKASLAPVDGAGRMADLWEGHHYSRGLAFVPQGTPTNNTSEDRAGFPPNETDLALSYRTERQGLQLDPDSDGSILMRALGLPLELATTVAGADAREQMNARAMNRALWPATLGYFLDQMLAHGYDRQSGNALPFDGRTIPDLLAIAQDYFVANVRGRGPYPSFRVGSTPYGVLPVTSLDRWTGAGHERVRAPDLIVVQIDQGGTEALRVASKVSQPQSELSVALEAGTPLDVSLGPCTFLLADWDRDGIIDLIVLRNRGTATHQTEWSVLSGAAGFAKILAHGASSLPETDDSYSFALADWDGDGTPDLAVIRQRGTATHHTEVTFLSGGSGFRSVVFEGPTSLPETDATYVFGLTDWDRDGRPDLVVVQKSGTASRHVEVRILSGASGFKKELLHADTGLPEISFALDVSLTDWDGDGIIDLVLGTGGSAGLPMTVAHVVSGASKFTTTFAPAQANLAASDAETGWHPRAVQLAADWDDDGRAELIVIRTSGTGSGGVEVTVLSSAPIGPWSSPIPLVATPGGSVRTMAIAIADLDGNGQPEAVLLQVQQPDARAAFYRIGWDLDPSGTPGRWSPDPPTPITPPFPGPPVGAGLGLVDLDRDGSKELLVFYLDAESIGRKDAGSLRIGWKIDAEGKVDHWSQPAGVPGITGAVQPQAYLGAGMAVADLEGNGSVDMLLLYLARTTSVSDPVQAFYRVGRQLDSSGRVAGGWSAPIVVPGSFLSTHKDLSVAVEDLNGDGRPELVLFYVDHAGANTAWYRIGWQLDAQGNVQGGWTEPRRVPGWTPGSIGGGLALTHVSSGGWVGFLSALREVWRRGIPRVPRVGKTDDLDGDLLSSLVVDASAREVRVRTVLGGDALLNLYAYLGEDFFFHGMSTNWKAWYAAVQKRAQEVMRLLGEPAWDSQRNEAVWRPRAAESALDSRTALLAAPLVAAPPLSEEFGLPPTGGVENYIAWLAKAPPVPLPPPANSISARAGVPSDQPMPLLYHLLRHALLLEYARAAFLVDIEQRRSSGTDPFDPELVGLVPGVGQRRVWDRLNDTLSITQPPGSSRSVQVGQYLWGMGTPEGRSLDEHRGSLEGLAQLPTAELDRLLGETLDVCSHRLDAWVTSMATKRVSELRSASPTGLYLGGFGWLEDVRPAPPGRITTQILNGQLIVTQNGGGGFVHAPSMSHASSAAILRNAQLTRGGAGSSTYALDLSSERVRVARELLDSVRAGQPLGAVLGYRIERILHEKGLQRYVDPLRQLFPLLTAQNPDATAPAGSTAARTVIDGLALRIGWPSIPWGQSNLPADASSEQQQLQHALDGELGQASATSTGSWLDPLDAVANLLMAESVYQLVRGNTTGAVASLDALAGGVRPPDPEIARAPRHGTPLTHRVIFVLGDPPVSAAPNWSNATPRAQVDPYLDGWVGSLLGDPTAVKCRVYVVTGTPPVEVDLGEITLAQLGMCPIDVLELARGPSALLGTSELDRRVAYAALAQAEAPVGADVQSIRITYAREPTWSAEIRSFPEILEVASAINGVVGSARALRPEDLLAPESSAPAANATLGAQDARSRAQSAREGLHRSSNALDVAIKNASGTAALRDALQVLHVSGDAYDLAINNPSDTTTLVSAFQGLQLSSNTLDLAIKNASDTAALGSALQELQAGIQALNQAIDSAIKSSADTPALHSAVEQLRASSKALDLSTRDVSDRAALDSALRDIALYGFPAAVPRIAKGTDATAASVLLEQGKSVSLDVQRRSTASTSFDDDLNVAMEPAKVVAAARKLVHAVFAREWPFVTGFQPSEAVAGELDRALGAQDTLMKDAPDDLPHTVRKWLQGAARVRPPLDRWRKLSLYLGALRSAQADWTLAQLPFQEGERWVGLAFSSEDARPRAGHVSLVLNRPALPAAASSWAGLLLDEWTEVIPFKEEQTGVSFLYDSPGSQPPQTILLAVSPHPGGMWDLEALIAALHETLDLAKMRGVDSAQLGALGQYLPAMFLAKNAADDTVSTDFRREIVAES